MDGDLILPPEVRYECVKCGRGCEDFEEILADAATVARVEALPWRELVAAGGAVPSPFTPSPFTPGETIMRKAEGKKSCSACVFLSAPDGSGEKLCALHAAHGLESKPLACQSFPYGFTETPGGVFVGLSFACTAALRNHGPLLADRPEDARAAWNAAPARRRASEPMLLSPGLPLTWAQYLAIEEDLLDLLGTEGAPIGEALIAQSVYLQMLKKFLLEARGMARGEWEGEPELNERLLAAFRKNMQGPAGARKWDRLWRIAQRPSSSRMLRRAFLGYAMAFRNVYGVNLGGVGTAFYVLGTYLRQAFGRGGVDLPRLDRPYSYKEITRVRFDATRPELAELLRRFFRHCLLRKDLLVQEEVAFAHNMALMHYGLIHWFSAAFAAAAGRGEVALDDLVEGVRAVEQYFVFHSKFSRLFTDHPKLHAIMAQIFGKPSFAFAMGRPESEFREADDKSRRESARRDQAGD